MFVGITVRYAVAETTPVPSSLAVNKAGATVCARVVPLITLPVPLMMFRSPLAAGRQCAGGRRLNPLAFSIPGGTEGSLGRNALRGFGLSELDLAIRRDWRVRNETTLQLRGGAFNALNHPVFGDPVPYLSSPLFGQSVSMLNSMLGTGSRTADSLRLSRSAARE